MSRGVAHGISRHRRGVTPAPHSCLREESTGLCCRGVFHLGRAFCGLCLGSRALARLPLALTPPLVDHGGRQETWLCTALSPPLLIFCLLHVSVHKAPLGIFLVSC